ncbi:unnamed protein product, partial [Porites lobata]
LIPGSSIGFIKTSASSRTVPEGSSVSLSCELSNSSIPVRLWMMMSGAMYTPRKNVVNYGQVFILHRVTRKMAGTYLCRVTRPRLNKNLGFIWVTERQRGTPILKVDQRLKTIFVNGDANLTCTASGPSIQSVQWYKWAQKLSMLQQVVTKKEFNNGDVWNNTLVLRNVQMNQAGWYECRIYQRSGDEYFYSIHEHLNVLGKNKCPEPDGVFAVPKRETAYLNCSNNVATLMNCPRGEEWTDDKKSCVKVIRWKSNDRLKEVTKAVGESVTIDCQLNDPGVRVKLKQKIRSGVFRVRHTDDCRVSRVGQKFVIHSVNFNDFGIYVCEAPHVMTKKEEAYLKINPDPMSSLYQGHRNLFATFGSSLDLNCGAYKVYQPRIYLEIIRTEGVTLLTPDGHKVTLTGRILTIHGLNSSMHGKIVCKVVSTCARIQEEVDLGQLLPVPQKGEPPKPVVSPEQSVVKEGNNINVTCSVSKGKKINSITWYKDKKLVPDELVVTSSFKSILILTNVAHSDAGIYECRVVDFGAGYWFSPATIKVEGVDTPTTPTTTPTRLPVVPVSVAAKPFQPADINCTMFIVDQKVTLWQETSSGKLVQRIPDGDSLILKGLVFTLMNVIDEDEGTYYCQAGSYQKVPAVRLSLIDTKPPFITNFVSRLSVNVSQTTRLICETEGHPSQADIHWLKDGVEVGRCTGEMRQQNKTCHIHGDQPKYKITWTGSGAELMVQNAFHPLDSGEFTCIASNAAGEDKKTLILDVHEKPVLSKKNDTGIRVLAFEAASTIQSTALRGHPIPYFEWYRQPIGFCTSNCKPDEKKWRRVPRSVINPSAQVPSRVSSLFLAPSKSGYYFRCVAENALGRDDVVYHVHRMDIQTVLPEIVSTSPVVRVDEKNSFRLLCQASAGDFQYLTWQKKGGGRMLTSELKTNDYNLTTTLSTEHAQLKDAGDYLCVGWTNNDTKISMITVFVKELAVPVVSLSNKTIFEAQTNKTVLHCTIASGYPAPNITWYKDGEQLKLLALGSKDDCRINGFHYMEKYRPPKAEYLVICRPSHVQNTGLYKCEAMNVVGNGSNEGYLNVLAQPKIINVDDTLRKDPGEQVNITCRATGNPAPAVKWVMKTGEGRHKPITQWSHENHTLRIDSVQEHHYGEYVCFAENEFGNDTVVLAVVRKTPIAAVRDPLPSLSKAHLIVAILVSVVLFILLLIIAAVLYRRRQMYGGFYICTTPPLPDLIASMDASIPLIEQVNKLPYDKRWEFPRDQLQFGSVLGSGAFGEVYLAEADGSIISDNSSSVSTRHRLSYQKDARRRSSTVSSKGPIKVAVKTLKEGADDSEFKDLQSELKMLIHIGSHKNIVNLLGACTKGRHCDLCVIIEYCPYGNMLQFLRKRRGWYEPTWLTPSEDPDKQFSVTDLVSAAFQVARAMEFLVSRKCVHRDLAARNVLVGANYVVKVADFGLARDVYKSDQYIKVSAGLVPVKWMAIESLADRVYSEQSDVWSFGVFLWELFTLGGSPYPGLPPTEIYNFIVAGNRMDQPVDCPEVMYFMMKDCWAEKPADRPNFTALVQRLDHVIESNMAAMGHEGYLDLGIDEPAPKEAETDKDGYLTPLEIISPVREKSTLFMNGNVLGSNKELCGSHRSVASETKIKDLLEVERYTELGFKPSSSANSLSETIL